METYIYFFTNLISSRAGHLLSGSGVCRLGIVFLTSAFSWTDIKRPRMTETVEMDFLSDGIYSVVM